MKIEIMRRAGIIGLCLVVFSLVSCMSQGAVASEPEANYEGLINVRIRSLDIAQVRPGTVFSSYTGIIFSEPELAFRTPDKSLRQFPLDDDQKQRFRDMLSSAFRSELAGLKNLELVDEPGENVLELGVRVENITATVPPGAAGSSGWAGLALVATGEATLILELRDSRSNEILARAVDIKVLQGAAMAQKDGMVTRWEDAEKLGANWASVGRSRLAALIKGR
jgi:hypothetical protein